MVKTSDERILKWIESNQVRLWVDGCSVKAALEQFRATLPPDYHIGPTTFSRVVRKWRNSKTDCKWSSRASRSPKNQSNQPVYYGPRDWSRIEQAIGDEGGFKKHIHPKILARSLGDRKYTVTVNAVREILRMRKGKAWVEQCDKTPI